MTLGKTIHSLRVFWVAGEMLSLYLYINLVSTLSFQDQYFLSLLAVSAPRCVGCGECSVYQLCDGKFIQSGQCHVCTDYEGYELIVVQVGW